MISKSYWYKILSNKYLLTLAVFLVWIAFFDRNDLVTQHERKKELQKLEASTTFYENEISSTRQDLTDLNNNAGVLEKFAREKFYLKKPNEDIFITVDSSIEKK